MISSQFNAVEWQGANWPSHEEIARGLWASKIHEKAAKAGIVAYVNKNTREIYIDPSASHNLIAGITESKKSRCCIGPLIKTCIDAEENLIVTDPKGELYMQMAPLLKQGGYTVYVLDFRSPRMSKDTWNPLALPLMMYRQGDTDACQELIDDFTHNLTHENEESTKDPFWSNMAGAYIGAIIRALIQVGQDDEVHMKSVRSIMVSGETRNGPPFSGMCINKFFESFGRNSDVFTMAAGTIETAGDTKKGILSTAHNHLQKFSSQEALVDMLANSSFDLADLGEKKKTALFILMSDEKTTCHSLITTLVKQVYEQLVRTAQLKYNGVLPIRVNMVLDEFSNIPCIKDFPSMISAARSRNIRITIAIQGYSQLESKYGKNDALTIFENCSNLLYLYSRNLEFIKMISGLCGTQYRFVRGFKEERHLIDIATLQHLEQGECLFFRNRTPAYICKLPDISEYLPYPEPRQMKLTPRPKRQLKVFDVVAYVKEHEEREKRERHEKNRREMFAAAIRSASEKKCEEKVKSLLDQLDAAIKDTEEDDDDEAYEWEINHNDDEDGGVSGCISDEEIDADLFGEKV